MIPKAVAFYNPEGPDLVAIVSTKSSTNRAGWHLVQVGRGLRATEPGKWTFLGPFSEDELPERFAEAVDALRAEGFEPTGLPALLEALDDDRPAIRGRAAVRLGWRGDRSAVAPLLSALTRAVDDVCPILDALGAIGDPSAIPAVRPHAERMLLSKRRSAVEALRNLGDAEGLAAAIERARGLLPESVRQALDAADSPEPVVKALQLLEPKFQGLAADTIYEIGSPVASEAAVRFLLGPMFNQAFIWRYVKSVLKRAMLRGDHAAFGRLVHAVEQKGRLTKGTKASVKSGYDGKLRQTSIFSRKTQNYLRRLGWRHLRTLARHRPSVYPLAAAEAIIPYGPEESLEPHGLTGQFARCYLLHRVLWGASDRFHFDARGMVFRYVDAALTQQPEGAREEPFPALWDAHPRAFLRILASARLPQAQEFALRAILTRHRDMIESASFHEIISLLDAPFESTVRLALDELSRRFDAGQPDWFLLDRLLAHPAPIARDLGRDWLRQTAPLWAMDIDRLLTYLDAADPATALLIADLAPAHLGADPICRRTLAAMLLVRLRWPEARPDAHAAPARLARSALLAEMGELIEIGELIRMASTGSMAVRALAGDLLADRPEALDLLGFEGIAALADNEVAAVRAAAHVLLQIGLDRLRIDPSPLFVLAESDWDDNRAVALGLIRDAIGLESLSFDALMGLLDSNRPEVQDLGKLLVKRRFADLPTTVLIERLAEHPHPNMRRFALDLVAAHWPDGAGSLAFLGDFFRAAVFDLHPDRLVKLRVIDFLLARGLRDENQAGVSSGLLGEIARLDNRSDSEEALEAMVRLEMAYPGVGGFSGLVLGGAA